MATYGGTVEKTANNGNSGTWSIPAGTSQIRGVAVAGGGSGHQDDTGDDKGGGGGGGGNAGGLKNVGGNTEIQWQQANRAPTKAGGSETAGSGSTDGEDSYVYGNTGRSWAYAEGGEGGTDDNGGAGGGSGSGNEFTGNGGTGQDDDAGGYGGGCAGCPHGINRGGGAGCTVTWDTSGAGAGSVSMGCGPTPDGNGQKEGGTFGGAGAGSWENSNPEKEFPAGDGGRGYAGWSYFYADPTIDSTNVIHQYNTNLALDDSPSDNVTIEWTASNVQKVEIKRAGIVYATETSSPTDGNATISAGLNSNAVSNSPATKNFNVVAYGYGGNTVSQSVTVEVKNDDNPNINSLVSVVDCDPGEEKSVNLGTLDEVDMPVWITCTEGSINNSLGQKKVGVGNNITLKAFALPYEVDITGREDEDTGKRASKTITLQIGPHKSHDVVFRTVRPTIKETFDSAGSINNLPYPKINIGSDSPSQYINASSVDVDNIDFTRAEINSRLEDGEISTEVKVSDDGCQIKRNSGSWRVPRGI